MGNFQRRPLYCARWLAACPIVVKRLSMRKAIIQSIELTPTTISVNACKLRTDHDGEDEFGARLELGIGGQILLFDRSRWTLGAIDGCKTLDCKMRLRLHIALLWRPFL